MEASDPVFDDQIQLYMTATSKSGTLISFIPVSVLALRRLLEY